MTMLGGYRSADREDTSNAYALAMTSAWAYSDIKLIADRISGSDARMKVQRQTAEGLTDEKEHSFHGLVNRPNSLMAGSFMLRYTAAWYLLRGNGYLFISTPGIGTGEPQELWPLPANQVLPRPETMHEGRGVFAGQAVIDYQYNVNGELQLLPGENIIHFRMPNPFDWWEGLSPLQAAILGIQSDHAQAVWQRDFYKEDNAIPSAIISVPQDTQPEDFDRQRALLAEQLRNGQKRLFTRSGDLKVEMISQTLEQMQIIESRQFNREEIDAVYGIPKGLVSGGLSGDSRLAAEVAFSRNAIQPMLDYFAEQFNADLAPYYGEDVVIVAPNVIPQDRSLEIQEYTIYSQDRTINENRKVLGLDEIKLPDKLAELQPFVDTPVRIIAQALTRQGVANIGTLVDDDEMAQAAGTLPGAQAPAAMVQDQAGKIAIDTELARWRKVALKAVRDGKPQREFVSEVIPATTKQAITERLIAATTEDGVRKAFTQEDGADQPFFTPEKAMLLLNPDDDEAEYKLRMALEADNEKRIKKAFVDMYDTVVPSGETDPNEIAARIQRDWKASQDLQAAITSALQAGVDLGVSVGIKQLAGVTSGFDWTLSNQKAKDWVSAYSFELIKGIDETSQKRTQAALQKWIENGKPLQGLIDDVSSIFGPDRATAIAVTESTRAYAQGNLIIYQDSGVVKKWGWRTAADDLVCPICAPLNGKTAPLGKDFDGYIFPAHVKCRCWGVPFL
jgi:HK97 family phage portal protein